jgi:DNA-binding transcriptional MerR regulator
MTRRRPKTPAPKTGFLLRELSQLSGVKVRTLRDWVAKDLLRPLQIRGTQTRYARSELIRLIAILRLRAETKLPFPQIKRKLEALGEQELERWILSLPLAPLVAQALGLTANTGAAAQAADTPTQPPSGGAETTRLSVASGGGATETWHHVPLLPGLVLQVNTRASAAVLRVAQRIHDEFRVQTS